MTSPTSSPRLILTDIAKSYGATRALDGVSVEVGVGEVHALIGENGAGKSTLMKVLSGVVQPDSGSMELEGAPYRPSDTLDARARGVAMIHQELSLAPHLNVWENIGLGGLPSRMGWLNRGEARRRAKTALARLAHEHLNLERPVAEFSIAEQQIIEIARALLSKPRVLIMDEPTSSLTQADTRKLFEVIHQLRAEGVSIIYISHFLEEVKAVADRYTVLKDGCTVGGGSMAEAQQRDIVRMMVGREVTDLYPQRAPRIGQPVLELAGNGGPLTVRAGEILGVAGLIGAGRTRLLRENFGLVSSARMDGANPRRSWRAGIGFLSEDRKEEGLMLPLSLAENTTLTKYAALSRFGWLPPAKIEAATQPWIELMGIKTTGPRQAVGALSGGNQQKVAMARLLEHPAQVLLLDEPTRGIDVGSKAQIYQLIAKLAEEGKAVVLVSSYLPELFGLCDRIAVMRRGAIVDCRDTKAWSEHDLMLAAVGAAN
ncbi:MAG: sugar ABC transporter ATP-binding protein [Opitutaceae bacterium]|nr:sugar ABC transporter ATP-binding protein [Opitutaceae bacterium]